jgi:DNA-binding Xre family transcriptional regulator
MRRRDVNASELAALAGTAKQNVSNVRRGAIERTRGDIAASIERALHVRHGELFDYDSDRPPTGVAS